MPPLFNSTHENRPVGVGLETVSVRTTIYPSVQSNSSGDDGDTSRDDRSNMTGAGTDPVRQT